VARHLTDWVDSYVEFTQGLKTSPRFCRWAGIGAVAAALQRRVTVRIEGQTQYANMYVLLVGPPGIGKGNAVKPASKILRKLGAIHLTPRGITKRAFYSEMEGANITDIDVVNQKQVSHCSLTAVIEEFGVFLRPRDIEFMDALADVYDNPPVWDYKTEHSGVNNAKNPCFNMLACTTPNGLRERFTDNIFEMGLPARITMVFADTQTQVPLFHEREDLPKLEVQLIHDLEQILQLKGEYQWAPETAAELEAWAATGFKPRPIDPRFTHYCTRRLAHITKLCIILAAARRDDPTIYPEDLATAREMLLEAESVMGGAVSAIGANPLKAQIQAARVFIQLIYNRHKKPVPEHKFLRFLYSEVPVQHVNQVIDALLQSAWIGCTGDAPVRQFFPMESLKDEFRIEPGDEDPQQTVRGDSPEDA